MSAASPGPLRSLLAGLSLPAALLAASLIFVLQPSLAYDPSLEFGLMPALLSLAACGLVFAMVAALPGAFGGQRWRDDYGAFLAAIALGLWGSSLLSLGSPMVLDGRPHEISPHFGAVLVNILLVLTIAFVGYVFGRRRKDAARFFLWALNALFAATAITAVAKAPSVTDPYRMDSQRLTTFSSSGNVLVVLLDSYQSRLFERLLLQDLRLGQEFDGFTYFPNANSSAPSTLFSLPAIHSGNAYSLADAEGQGFDEYFSAAVEARSFLAELSRSDYRVQLLNPLLHRCPRGVDCFREYALHMGGGESLAQASLYLLGLSLYTVVPLQWKQFAYNDGNWLVGGNAMSFNATRGYETLEWLSGSIRVDDGPPTAKFLHLFTTHLPPVLNEKCVQAERLRITERVLLDQARCTNRAVFKLLSALRSKGVYESSTIIILADHGAGISSDGFHAGGRASPLLLVKTPGSSGPLKIDQSLFSLLQIKSLVCETTRGCAASSATSSHGGDRVFTDYRWDADVWIHRGKRAVTWYQIEGPPARIESWRRTAPAVPSVRSLKGNEDDPSASYGLGWTEVGETGGKTYWSDAPVSSVFLNLPDARPYSVSIKLESDRVPSPNVGLEVLVDSELIGSQALTVAPHPGVRLTVMGHASRPIELRFRTTGIPEEDYSLDRTKPLFRIVQLQVD